MKRWRNELGAGRNFKFGKWTKNKTGLRLLSCYSINRATDSKNNDSTTVQVEYILKQKSNLFIKANNMNLGETFALPIEWIFAENIIQYL